MSYSRLPELEAPALAAMSADINELTAVTKVLLANIDMINNPAEGYKRSNPARLAIISQLLAVKDFLDGEQALSLTGQVKEDIIVAAYAIALENIEAGLGKFEWHSSLATLLRTALTHEKIDDKQKLISIGTYIDKYLNTFVNDSASQSELNDQATKAQIRLIARLKPEIEKIEQAVPVESVIDAAMTQMNKTYAIKKVQQGKAENPERKSMAQLVQVIASANPAQLNETNNPSVLPNSMRIKVGMLLLTMSTLTSSSELYKACEEALNGVALKQISTSTQLTCLLALQRYLKTVSAYDLQKQALALFSADKCKTDLLVNPEIFLHKVEKAIETRLAVLTKATSAFAVPSTTKALGITAAALAALPGGAGGAAIGFTCSQISKVVITEMSLTPLMQAFLSAFLSNRMSDYAASYAVSLTAGYLFELSGGVILAATTGVAVGGISIVTMMLMQQLSTKIISELYLLMSANAKLPTELDIVNVLRASEKEIRFVDALLKLPTAMLGAQVQDRIERVTGHASLFAAPVPTAPVRTASTVAEVQAISDAARAAADPQGEPTGLPGIYHSPNSLR